MPATVTATCAVSQPPAGQAGHQECLDATLVLLRPGTQCRRHREARTPPGRSSDGDGVEPVDETASALDEHVLGGGRVADESRRRRPRSIRRRARGAPCRRSTRRPSRAAAATPDPSGAGQNGVGPVGPRARGPQAGPEVADAEQAVRRQRWRPRPARAAAAPATSAARSTGAWPGTNRSVTATTARGCRRRRSPAGRRTTPITEPAMPYMLRVVDVSWAATRAVAGEDPAAQRQPDPDGDRVRRGQREGHQAHGHQRAEHDVGEQGVGERGGQGRVPADGGRPDQLVTPALLLGAGVPADQEHAHQPGHDRAERRGLPRHLAADGVERAGGACHRDERGVALPCCWRPCRTPPGSCTAPSR